MKCTYFREPEPVMTRRQRSLDPQLNIFLGVLYTERRKWEMLLALEKYTAPLGV